MRCLGTACLARRGTIAFLAGADLDASFSFRRHRRFFCGFHARASEAGSPCSLRVPFTCYGYPGPGVGDGVSRHGVLDLHGPFADCRATVRRSLAANP